MYSTTYFEHKLSRIFEPKQAEVLAETIVEAYNGLVQREDFNELKSLVREIAQAQKELTVAQQRTEKRVEELVVAQQDLTVAQQRTEHSLRELIGEHKETRKQLKETRQEVGGLATTVGYTLENQAYKTLPSLLQRDFGLIVQGPLKRGYLTDNKGKELEVNIIGQALQDGKTVTIIGESKSQLSKSKIDSFIRKRLQRFEGVIKEPFPILITHMISSSDVEEYAKSQGIALYYSYDFE
ncbi:conserved hypothetical protein [Beggiatoa sp. PS]|nr:conserved hypothetical protein [Beggiatoa sp. PS]